MEQKTHRRFLLPAPSIRVDLEEWAGSLLGSLVSDQFGCSEKHHPKGAGSNTAELRAKGKMGTTGWALSHCGISLNQSPELPAETKGPGRELKTSGSTS